MNFFEAQERAYRSTRWLVLWFILCVIGVVASLYFVALLFEPPVASYMDAEGPQRSGLWRPNIFVPVAFISTLTIVGGSLIKLLQLSAGGSVVAESLHGRLIEQTTTDPLERRLLNVVQEMAIASSMPAPSVYVMDYEPGINAFAAGTDPANAVIGVTRGTLEHLNRSELQGVIAHEFSHILNGDMKLNMRLMGWIFGLVMVSVLGKWMVNSIRLIGELDLGRISLIILVIVALGIPIWIIGAIGTLFARLLQAAISREREYLADASAVQFTRNPEGIVSALKKVGGNTHQGRIESAHASEVRHMFFAGSALSRFLATHPPLSTRIRAIDPNWDGKMIHTVASTPPTRKASGAMQFDSSGPSYQQTTPEVTPSEEIEYISLTTDSAKSILFGMLIPPTSPDQVIARNILAKDNWDDALIQECINVSNDASEKSTSNKLKQIEHVLPLFRSSSKSEAKAVLKTMDDLIKADHEINMFELMVQEISKRHIEISTGLRPAPKVTYQRVKQVESELSQLLAMFASLNDDDNSLKESIAEYLEHTGDDLMIGQPDFDRLPQVLDQLDQCTPLVKRQILRMCSLVVMHDGLVSDSELELMRATAEAMGCALPRNLSLSEQL